MFFRRGVKLYDYSFCPNRIVFCVDMTSFYASVSCVKRGLDPLKTKLAVVGDVNRSGSVILAATAPLKKMGIRQGQRLYQIEKRKDILVVNPTMETYIKCSNYISKIALQYVAPCDFHQYSCDEFFMDVSSSFRLFAKTPGELAIKLKREIFEKTKLHCAIGIGVNPLISKICLDNSAKKKSDGIDYWTYEDVQEKFWPIRPLHKFWGISYKTEEKLNRKGIYTIGDLAKYPVEYLKQEFGSVLGMEYHLHSHGIDFSRISDKHVPAATSIGKSQILLRDYKIEELPIVLLEHTEEVCYRIRKQHKLARTVHIDIGYSKEYVGGIRKTVTLSRATNITMDIYNVCLKYVLQMHTGEPIRSINIVLSNLVADGEEQLSIFDDIEKRERQYKLTNVMDEIRSKYGRNSILRGISYTPASTIKFRNTLLGGHKA